MVVSEGDEANPLLWNSVLDKKIFRLFDEATLLRKKKQDMQDELVNWVAGGSLHLAYPAAKRSCTSCFFNN